MIRKLRLKFICVNMLIVTLMLTAIFGMVYHLTRQGLETQSEAMLQSVASDAFHPNRPGSPPQDKQALLTSTSTLPNSRAISSEKASRTVLSAASPA